MNYYNDITIDRAKNGNPVIHFLNAVMETEQSNAPDSLDKIPTLYRMAVNKARSFGGKKYHNQSYGGGIVFPDEEHLKLFIDSLEN